MKKTVLALVLVLTACSTPPHPRPLSIPEAERLALARFSNYTTGVRTFTASVPSPGGKLVLEGRVDEPKGDPGNTLTRAEIDAKARRLAAYGRTLDAAGINALMPRLWSIADRNAVGRLV